MVARRKKLGRTVIEPLSKGRRHERSRTTRQGEPTSTVRGVDNLSYGIFWIGGVEDKGLARSASWGKGPPRGKTFPSRSDTVLGHGPWRCP